MRGRQCCGLASGGGWSKAWGTKRLVESGKGAKMWLASGKETKTRMESGQGVNRWLNRRDEVSAGKGATGEEEVADV